MKKSILFLLLVFMTTSYALFDTYIERADKYISDIVSLTHYLAAHPESLNKYVRNGGLKELMTMFNSQLKRVRTNKEVVFHEELEYLEYMCEIAVRGVRDLQKQYVDMKLDDDFVELFDLFHETDAIFNVLCKTIPEQS